MELDTLSRRTRTKRQPRGKRLYLTKRDLLWLSVLERHGPLATSILYQFGKHLGHDKTGATKRLCDLRHETGYIDCPGQQFATIDARHNQLVYQITTAGLAVLEENGQYRRTTLAGGPFKHQSLVSSVTASIELATWGTNIRFIPQHEILAIQQAPLKVPLSIVNPAAQREERHALIPDALFALEYRSGDRKSYRTFMLEIDRGTEPLQTNRFPIKSFRRSLLQYREFVRLGLAKPHYGIQAPVFVLNLLLSEPRLKNMMQLTAKESASGRNSYQLFMSIDGPSQYYTVPAYSERYLLGGGGGGWDTSTFRYYLTPRAKSWLMACERFNMRFATCRTSAGWVSGHLGVVHTA